MFRAERLSIPRPGAARLRHWGEVDPWWVADRVRQEVIGGGVTLPVATISDGPVCAVVEWDQEILSHRLANGHGPVLYRNVLADRVRSGRTDFMPAPLRVLGYINLGLLRRPLDTMARLSGMAWTIAAVPTAAGVDQLLALECDLHGFTLTTVGPDCSVHTVVSGPTKGSGEGRGVLDFYFWLRAEQLFDIAIRTGGLPVRTSA